MSWWMRPMTWRFAAGVVALVLLAGAAIWWLSPRDSTDPPAGRRSGLVILTDHLTGCQYLGASRGGVTPRLRADGSQICR